MERSWSFAMQALNEGWYVRRRSWPKGVWVQLLKGEMVEREGKKWHCIDGDHYDTPQMVRIRPAGTMHPTRDPYWAGFSDLSANDWLADPTPNLIVTYSATELIAAAETGRPVFFHPTTDRLQQNGFVALGEPQPGWEYVDVKLAVRRAPEGST